MIPHSKPWINAEDLAAVQSRLQEGMLASGSLTSDFEQAVAQYLGMDVGLSVPSGTVALVMALKALEIEAGDEVILPTYVCNSVSRAVRASGGIPVLCDIGPYWTMTAQSVSQVISSRTKAVIVVHPFGIQAETFEISALGYPVIEDCAQAFAVGPESLSGALVICSFQATKCLTTGEGGMVLTAQAHLAEKLKQLQRDEPGFKRLSDFQAALGLSQLSRYQKALERRAEIASRYFEAFPQKVTARLNGIRERSLYFRFPLCVPPGCFDLIRKLCEEKGVQVRRGVDELIHRLEGQPDERYFNAVARFEETLSLPIYPAMDDVQVERVISVVNATLQLPEIGLISGVSANGAQ
jgi:perosamine synthetase